MRLYLGFVGSFVGSRDGLLFFPSVFSESNRRRVFITKVLKTSGVSQSTIPTQNNIGIDCMSSNPVSLIPIHSQVKFERFELAEEVQRTLARNSQKLRNRDILVVSSKFAAVSEGRVRKLSDVLPSSKAVRLSRLFEIDPRLAQLILEESSEILGGIPGFALALTKSGACLAPNAGIDRSNAPEGWVVLYPKKPEFTASSLRSKIIENSTDIRDLGVILSDSRVTPTRLGTVGVALAVSGIRATIDERGNRDLFGNTLKVTLRAIADDLATAAQLVMGEAREATPIVLVRGFQDAFGDPKNRFEESMNISPEKCLILQGLKNSSKTKTLIRRR